MSPFAVAGLWDLRRQPWRRLAQGEPTEECWGRIGWKTILDTKFTLSEEVKKYFHVITKEISTSVIIVDE